MAKVMLPLVLLLSIVGLIVGIGLYNKDFFCNCYGMQTSKRCPDPKVLMDLYNKGILTEYTDLTKIPSIYKDPMPYDHWSNSGFK